MSKAGKTSTDVTSPVQAERRGASRRGRLLWRTFVVAFVLVSGGLVTGGALELYFRYLESVENIRALQQEMARGAAFEIQQFVRDIDKTLRVTAQSRENVMEGITEKFRFSLSRMMKTAPAITKAVVISPNGMERMQISRLELTSGKAPPSYAGHAAFTRAIKGETYFGEVYFVRQSEPYMQIAVPMEWFAGTVEGVLLAEVNLKYIWEVVNRIKVGEQGYAYVVARKGDLIAHPDISLVLQKRVVNQLEQVRAALAGTQSPPGSQLNVAGEAVFSTYARIPELGWAVMVERPTREAYTLLMASLLRTSLLLMAGLAMAVLASLLIGRRVVLPLRTLREGAARVGGGALAHRIQINTGDELEDLADEFNNMADRLQDSYAGLEQKVDERTRELAEALEQQTATAQILRVISESPTNLSPVFDTILENACKLCDAELGLLFLIDGNSWYAKAFRGCSPQTIEFMTNGPIPVGAGGTLELMMKDPQVIHVVDAKDDADYAEKKLPLRTYFVDVEKARTFLQVPMLHQGQLAGVIMVYRKPVRAFEDKQIALLETFAQQGVIAIENARLFEELQERSAELAQSVGELQALQEVGRAVSSTLDLETMLTTIVTRAVQLSGAIGGMVFEHDEHNETFNLTAAHGANEALLNAVKGTNMRIGVGAVGQAAQSRVPVQVADIASSTLDIPQIKEVMVRLGHRSLLVVPLLSDQSVLGALVVWRQEAGALPDSVVNLLQTFATQSSLAIRNARLFREIEQRGHELEVASRHKSQFLANMSHELRTPLNAILGYTELIVDEIYGGVPDKVREVLERVELSGRHLLGLINDVLDLSKIEAGQLDLSISPYSMQNVMQNVAVAVESLATEKSLKLDYEVAENLPMGRGDEQRITQVLLNLAGNAIKFTEKGRIQLKASTDNGHFLISVSDTGPGISEEDQEHIFSEFHQADASSTKTKGGTGLGLAIAKRFIEMHGGKIWVKSRPSEGSTFYFSLPVETQHQRSLHE